MKKLFFGLICLFICSSGFATNWCEDANVLACYTFEEASGDLIDQSSNGQDGTIVGTVTQQATGKFGYGYDLDGSDDYISLDSGTPINSATKAVVGWVKLDLLTVMEFINDQQDTFSVRPNDGTGTKAKVTIKTSSGYTSLQTSSGYCGLDTWCHIASIYDKTNVEIFLEGVSKGTSAQTNDLNTVTGNTHLGMHGNGSANDFNGTMDEVAIFSSLDSTDINDIMDNGLVQVASSSNLQGATFYGCTIN